MVIKAWDARWLRMKAKNQKPKVFLALNRARSPPVQQWRLDRSLVFIWYYLPSFSSPVPSSLVWLPPEQDYESTIHMSFLFVFSFKIGPSELFCIWSYSVCDVLFLYLIKRVVPFMNLVFLCNNYFLKWGVVSSVGLRIDATDNNEKLSPPISLKLTPTSSY